MYFKDDEEMKRLEKKLDNERKRKTDAEKKYIIQEKRLKMVRLKETLKAVSNETQSLLTKTREYKEEIQNSEFKEEGKKLYSQ